MGIQHRKQELERDCHAIQRETVELTQTHNTVQQNFDTLTDKVDDLYNEKCQLEQFVSRYKNGNREYLEIRGVAEQIVNYAISRMWSAINFGYHCSCSGLKSKSR